MRILLAEDEKSLSAALVTILKHNNYSVDAVYNGQDALDYLCSCDNYDAAILDIMMPGLDGLTVLSRLRASGSRLPVLLLTARSETEDKIRGLDAGADDYLTKPFAVGELLARLRVLIRRQGETRETVLTYGDARLDTCAFTLAGNRGEVQLTSKEYQIMEIFMRNPTAVTSAETFMERVWGYDSEAEISVVWTYISYLRKKLRLIGSSVTIRAVRNIGYTLDVGK